MMNLKFRKINPSRVFDYSGSKKKKNKTSKTMGLDPKYSLLSATKK